MNEVLDRLGTYADYTIPVKSFKKIINKNFKLKTKKKTIIATEQRLLSQGIPKV